MGSRNLKRFKGRGLRGRGVAAMGLAVVAWGVFAVVDPFTGYSAVPGSRASTSTTRAGTAGAAGSRASGSAAGARATSTLSAPRTTSSAPASGTAPAAGAVQADDLLKGFPKNATALAARADAKKLTLEGRIRDIYKDAKGANRIVVVGKMQADDFAPHFTCHMDTDGGAAVSELKAGEVIRVTGAIGDISTAENRIVLQGVRDVVTVEKLTAATMILGRWYDHVGIPGTNEMGYWDVEFHADGTAKGELSDEEYTVLKSVTGTWSMVSEGEPAKIRMKMGDEPEVESELRVNSERLNLSVPGFADRKLGPLFSGGPRQGKRVKVDYKGVGEQARKWVAANTALRDPKPLLEDLTRELEQYTDMECGYTFVLGANLLKNKKGVALVGTQNKFIRLEFSDAQSASYEANGMNAFRMRSWGELLEPEVKIDSLVLENKGRISGKLTMHTLGKPHAGGYALIMAAESLISYARFERSPGPDPQVFEFSFSAMSDPPPSGIQLPQLTHPLPALFSVGRGVNMDYHVVSEPQAKLLD